MAISAAAALALLSPAVASAAPLAPVAQVDVERYASGTWYQLATIPAPFSIDCYLDATAEYAVIDENNIAVTNSCTTFAGERRGVEGNARANGVGEFHVSFRNIPFQGSEDGPTNYVLTYVADDYSWALVGNPSRTSAWVLSRTPAVSDDGWRQIRSVVEARGFNSCFLMTSPTTGGLDRIVPLCTLE
ncbi:lipocalin family protein [Millisia brevis]|uniref:lipocalin family protein n=1 Tax=Millisia brevis TaxID=264148 RepID=UPI0034E2B0AF